MEKANKYLKVDWKFILIRFFQGVALGIFLKYFWIFCVTTPIDGSLW